MAGMHAAAGDPWPVGRRHYTVHADRRVDERIGRDLTLIRGAVRDLGLALDALVLAGGFGRGEGSVVFTPAGPVPFNDYDLVAVTQDPGAHRALARLAPALARRLSLRHVDFLTFRRTELASSPVSQHLYDLKHGGTVLDGDPDILECIPDVRASAIPTDCARTLLVNRLTCLLESVTEQSLARPPEGEALLMMEYMAHKVVLCAQEALLILAGAYDASYARRADLYARAFPARREAIALVRESTRFKLEATRAGSTDPIGLWFAARDFYLETLRECLQTCCERAFPSWQDYARIHEESSWQHVLRRVKWYWLDAARHADVIGARRKQQVEMAELFLLAARGRDGSSDAALEHAARRRLDGLVPGPRTTWEDLRAAAVQSDYRFVHPAAPWGAGEPENA